MLTAVVMAGGRGTRMGGHVEKPLVEVRGVPMLDRVVEALRGAEAVRRVIVVASRHTPSTYARALRLGVEAFMGRGAGYVEDLHMAVRWAGLKGPILVAPCDLPLIDSEVVDLVAQCYLRRSRSPAMSVAVPHSLVELLGLRPSYVVEVSGLKVALSGVNVVEASRVGFKQIAEEVLVVEDLRLAVNVNTPDDLEAAERLLTRLKGPALRPILGGLEERGPLLLPWAK